MLSILTAVRNAFVQETIDGRGRVSRHLMILIAVAVVLAAISLAIYIKRYQPPAGGAYRDKVMAFRCTSCDRTERYTLGQVRKMLTGPNVGVPIIILTCPDCKTPTLVQAAECSKCGEVFFVKPDQTKSRRCPVCGTDYLNRMNEASSQE